MLFLCYCCLKQQFTHDVGWFTVLYSRKVCIDRAVEDAQELMRDKMEDLFGLEKKVKS